MAKYIAALIIIIVAGASFLYFQRAEAPTNMPTPSEAMPDMKTESASQGATNMGMESNPTVTIDISGKNFEFSQKEIRVREGDIVQINFVSESGFHDWVLDEFNARTAQVQTGGTSSVTFVADKKGTFEYYCSVGQHRANGMVGKLIVE